MRKGTFILVIGPTGSGKGTLMRHAMERIPELVVPNSYTTRPPRQGDNVEGKHYCFVSVEEFETRRDNGEFLEWAKFGDNYYGTRREEVLEALQSGKVLVKEIEVQGARQVRDLLPKEQLMIVYIDAGPWEELARRARARAPITEEELAKRRQRYEDEITFKAEADKVIENPDGGREDAQQQFEQVLRGALGRTAD
ncbi:MAG TPA: guanylate kinase [Candidatus Paceibacterota bacterium]|nr:guanylate kinase [Candidatus Paceibacterota bacterium]